MVASISRPSNVATPPDVEMLLAVKNSMKGAPASMLDVLSLYWSSESFRKDSVAESRM
jgi:hypothetical protein